LTTIDPRQQFLDLESKASQLVDSLTRLKEESDSYKTATDQLDGVAGRIGGILDSLISVSEEMSKTASGLNEFGTPQIIESQKEIMSSINEIVDKMSLLELKVASLEKQSKKSILLRLLTFR